MLEQASKNIQLDTIRFSNADVAEMEGNIPHVFISRKEVTGIHLVFAPAAQRPLVSVVLGVLLILLSTWPLISFVHVYIYGGFFVFKWAFAVAFAIPGIYMIRDLRKRWLLLVNTAKGTKKLVFRTCEDPQQIEAFLSEACSRYSYPVHTSQGNA